MVNESDYAEAFVIDFVRDPETTGLCLDFLDATLACVYELLQYSSHLQACPHVAECLLTKRKYYLDQGLIKSVLGRMREEWELVMEMEGSTSAASLLSMYCPYTKHQLYREIHGALESSSWELSDFTCKILNAWFPVISSSSLVEDVFANMADTVKRSTKRETASLAGLQAAAVRATSSRCRQDDDDTSTVKGVKLQPEDHEGVEVRGLRAGIWRPESSQTCFWAIKFMA